VENSSVPSRLTIVHSPCGIDHPYEPSFEERRPRDPSGGDMVALGFLTQPGGAAESVRVEWTRNGRPQTTIGARPLALGTDEDRWLVELGVVEASDAVTYQVIGTTADGTEVATPEFRFATRRWHTAARIAPCDAHGRFSLIGANGEHGPVLSLTQAEDTCLVVFEPAFDDHASDRHIQGADIQEFLGEVFDPSGARAPAIRWQTEGDRLTAIEVTGALSESERLVGFGERFDALDQRGRALDSTVYEQYKNQGNRTYLPVPFFLSSDGYGLLIEGTAGVEYDLGRTVPDRWRCLAHVPSSGRLAFRSFAGTPEGIVRALTATTGRPEPLPHWAYGLWMSSNEWNTQARVEHEVAETVRHGIPATVLVIEAWSDETTFYIWNGAQYQPKPGSESFQLADFTFPADGPWPDPAAMTNALHDQGIRLVLWQIPALKDTGAPHPQHDADVTHALDHEFVLRNEDATPYRNPFFWFNDAFIPDFTNEDATRWWMEKRRYLLEEIGIDGFKTDGGEHLAGRGIRSSDGRQGDELVNAYPLLYIGAYHDYAREHRNGDALTFSRAGYTGIGKYPAQWAGDENSTWEAYRRSIIAGLTAGLSGVIFWGWDIAGFSDALPSAVLFLRSTAMAAFCPIMQYHSEYNPSGPSRDRTPWNIAAHSRDERSISLFRHFARVRMNLLPYIVREADHAAAAGTPLMRPLLLDHPDDPVAWTITDQYRFGRSLLIAPVVEGGATTRTFYLPDGAWIDFWTGERHEGGQWLTVDAPWDRIPVFAPAGSVISLRLGMEGRLGEDTGNGLSLTDGLTWWLAIDRETRTGGDDDLGLRFAPGADGQLIISLPPLDRAVRIAAPGFETAEVAAFAASQEVTLRPATR
jgi:alpha-glucosidase (family GH31 glycosyl hydrolase)